MTDQQWNRLYFDEWVAREGIDLIRGYKVEDVYTVDLKPWARTGGNAVQIQLDGTGEMNAAYVQEIPPGKHLNPLKHLWEELVYVLSGQGSTSVWLEGGAKQTFEWKANSLFAIPLNAWYQHFNGSGSEPARYVAVTTAPIMMNLIRNDDFIFNNPFVFNERYAGENDYFSRAPALGKFTGGDVPTNIAYANFVPDIDAFDFHSSIRGVGTRGMNFELVNGVLGSHTLRMGAGTFTKIHRHGPGAHVLYLKGEGYCLMWPDGGEKVQEYWGRGTMVVPPSWWWHQHAVVSNEPAQYLALKLRSKINAVNRLSEGSMKSTKRGGSQVDYEDFPPALMEEVKRIFTQECAKRGTPAHMEAVYGG